MVEIKFVSNYLSRFRFQNAWIVSLLFLSVCFILSSMYWNNSFDLALLLSAKPSQIFDKGEYWRLFSSFFIHADLKHLLSNSMMLYILSFFVTSFYGHYVLPLFGVIGGALINALVLYSFESDITLVGASGVVYMLWGFWFSLYLIIDNKYSFISRLIRVLGVFLILLVPTSYAPQTSYLAHYLGFVIGGVFGLIYYPLIRSRVLDYQAYVCVGTPEYLLNEFEETRTLSQIE